MMKLGQKISNIFYQGKDMEFIGSIKSSWSNDV